MITTLLAREQLKTDSVNSRRRSVVFMAKCLSGLTTKLSDGGGLAQPLRKGGGGRRRWEQRL